MTSEDTCEDSSDEVSVQSEDSCSNEDDFDKIYDKHIETPIKTTVTITIIQDPDQKLIPFNVLSYKQNIQKHFQYRALSQRHEVGRTLLGAE